MALPFGAKALARTSDERGCVRAAVLGCAAGVWWLQQQAALPGRAMWLACGALLLVSLGAMRWRREWIIVAACVCGFSYAAWRAEWRLAPHLPVAYEQRDIALTGVIRGLPDTGEEGVRFLFEVESNGAGLRDFPRLVRLTWMPASGALPTLEAGQRWTFGARLKRPHGEANFGLRDIEVSMLERGIRATGYVSMSRRPLRLAHDAIGPALMIERLRAPCARTHRTGVR
jgi:competence protein ComEC